MNKTKLTHVLLKKNDRKQTCLNGISFDFIYKFKLCTFYQNVEKEGVCWICLQVEISPNPLSLKTEQV